jgi:hypothetical protein
VDGEAVAQRVRRYIRVQPRLARIPLDDEPQSLSCQLLAAMIKEKGALGGVAGKLGAAVGQIVGQEGQRGFRR